MKIDHLGYAVKRLDRALTAFESVGFVFGPVIDDTARNVQIAFGENDGYRIELLCPLDRHRQSPVDEYLNKNGPIPYHICYKSSRFDADVKELVRSGFRVVVPPAEAIAFGGKRVAFLIDLGMGLMEVVEE